MVALWKRIHVWGVSALCWAIWKSRNKACFEKKIISNPLEVICHMCALMKYWTGLYVEPDKEQLLEGINTMLQVAERILKRKEDKEAGKYLQDGDRDGSNDAPA